MSTNEELEELEKLIEEDKVKSASITIEYDAGYVDEKRIYTPLTREELKAVLEIVRS